MADVPQWLTNAIASLGGLATNADRSTRLTYGGSVQQLANTFGYPIPSPQEDATFPHNRGLHAPTVHPDQAGNAYRAQVQPELTGPASFYAGNVPVGDVWSDVAPLAQKQWNGATNQGVSPDKGWQNGTRAFPLAPGLPPFAAMYMTRPAPRAAVPEQGHWDTTGGGTNVTNENDAGSSTWVVDQPAQPAVADPSQVPIPMSHDQQLRLRMQVYKAILNQMGGIDTNSFNQDLGTYIQQDPSVLNEIQYLNDPFYTNMPDNEKLKNAWSTMGARRGAALKNTPIGSYYTGVLK